MKIDPRSEPRIAWSQPQVASLGLPEAEARAAAGTIRVLRWPFSENAAAQAAGETEGFVKAVVDRKGRILGVTIVGARAGELIGEAQLIYGWEGFPEDVAPLVHAHPTQNEALGEAHLALAGKPLHAHS